MNTQILKKFKEVLDELDVKYEEVYLFGSRAEHKDNEDSDWDFYILLKDDMDFHLKRKLKGDIRMKFHDYYPDEPVDIIINDKETFNSRKNIVNTISHEIYSKGVLI